MDNLRLILLLSLGVVLFLIYQAWMEDYGRIPQAPVTTASEQPLSAPTGDDSEQPALPSDAPNAPPAMPVAATGQSGDAAAPCKRFG